MDRNDAGLPVGDDREPDNLLATVPESCTLDGHRSAWRLGSGLVVQSRNATVAAMQMAKKKCGRIDRNGAFAPFVRLLPKATHGVTIAVISSRERKRRQPGLAMDDPPFVDGHQAERRPCSCGPE
jgi:hypothetical protein